MLRSLFTENTVQYFISKFMPAGLPIALLMEKTGYPTDLRGICNGVAMMGAQAFLIDDMGTFNHRFDWINTDTINCIKLIKTGNMPHVSEITKEERKKADLIAFLDGVALYQSAQASTNIARNVIIDNDGVFYEKNEKNKLKVLSNIIASQELEKAGGMESIAQLTAIFDNHDVDSYFGTITKLANKHHQRISIKIHSTNHAISVHYDPNTFQWYITNNNKFEVKDTNISFASWIKLAFSNSDPLFALSSTVLVTGNAVENAKKFAAELESEHERINKLSVNRRHDPKLGFELVLNEVLTGQISHIKEMHNEGFDFKKKLPILTTPVSMLYAIVTLKNIDALRELLDTSEWTQDEAQIALLVSLMFGNVDAISELHNRKLVDLNIRLKGNLTPLGICIIMDRPACLEKLLEFGIDPNALVDNNLKPIDAAILHARTNILALLLKNKKLNLVTTDGESTPLHYVCLHPYSDKLNDDLSALGVPYEPDFKKMIGMLLEAGLDINAKDKAGMTPLLCAAFAKNARAVSSLLERNPQINCIDNENTTPLYYAAQNNDIFSVARLLSYGADASISLKTNSDNDGEAPVFVAAELGHTRILDIFNGAHVNLTQARADGMTPAAIAAKSEHKEAFTFLNNAKAVNRDATKGYFRDIDFSKLTFLDAALWEIYGIIHHHTDETTLRTNVLTELVAKLDTSNLQLEEKKTFVDLAIAHPVFKNRNLGAVKGIFNNVFASVSTPYFQSTSQKKLIDYRDRLTFSAIHTNIESRR